MKIKHLKLPPAPLKLGSERGLDFYIKGEGPFKAQYAASTCTRCGACLQRCPSFKALKSELYSPRGRSQLLKYIFERKLNLKQDKTDILNTSASCLMCGTCTDFCPAKTPVSDLMAELNFSLLGKRKTKASALRKIFSRAYARHKILRAAKRQPALEKEIIFLPSLLGFRQIKDSLKILNEAGFSALTDLNAAELEHLYFCADIMGVRKVLRALLKLSEENPADMAVDSAEIFSILKKAALFGKEFTPLSNRVKFITQYIKAPKSFKVSLSGKKIILHHNSFSPELKALGISLAELFVCPQNIFLLECIQSKQLPSAGASYWTEVKGNKIITAQIADTLESIEADYLAVSSYADKNLFKKAARNFKQKRLKILHVSQIPEEFYGKNSESNPHR